MLNLEAVFPYILSSDKFKQRPYVTRIFYIYSNVRFDMKFLILAGTSQEAVQMRYEMFSS